MDLDVKRITAEELKEAIERMYAAKTLTEAQEAHTDAQDILEAFAHACKSVIDRTSA